MLGLVDTPSVAETLPESYRRVLDRVADLETAGHRREADLVRRDATAAYSKRWNARTAVRLDRLAERAERVLDGRARARAPYASRRPAVAVWLAWAPARVRSRLAMRAARRRTERGAMRLERPAA